MNREILISITSGLVGVLLTIMASWYISEDQLFFLRRIEMVKLSRELANEFLDEKSIYTKIFTSIDRCEPLYWGGEIKYEEVSKYLLFFDNLGLYAKQGVIDYNTIDQIFGAHIIEAHQKGEIRKYIYDSRKNNEQNQAFDDFEELAEKLEKIPERKAMVDKLKASACFAFKGDN